MTLNPDEIKAEYILRYISELDDLDTTQMEILKTVATPYYREGCTIHHLKGRTKLQEREIRESLKILEKKGYVEGVWRSESRPDRFFFDRYLWYQLTQSFLNEVYSHMQKRH